ncbi:MAG: hypothetical protein LBS65_09050 [Desulfovibrio sp.]|nr:hypothetical protein [Desulfovibrio sp.]
MRKKTFSCGVFAPAFRLLPISGCLVCLLAAFCLLVGVPAAGAASEAGIVIEIMTGPGSARERLAEAEAVHAADLQRRGTHARIIKDGKVTGSGYNIALSLVNL